MPTTAAEIETLFDYLSAQPRAIRICKRCGCGMVNVDLLCFGADGERSWNLPLPVCPQCSAPGLQKLVSTEAT